MPASTDLKGDLRRSLSDLRRLVNEIRLDVRMAGTDARKRWNDLLEPQLAKTEKLVHELAEVSRTAVHSTATAFGEFKASLEKRPVRRARRRARAKSATSTH